MDSLVQQARVPERFAYGALAAYQAIPRFAEDLARCARRGASGPEWRLASAAAGSLLVLAIRHGDRKALAMDARAFGSVPRSAYRVVVWGAYDVWIALAGLFVAWAVLVIGR